MAEDKKPSIFNGGKDMLLSLGIIVILMAIFVLPTGMCTYSPGGAKDSTPQYEADPAAFLTMESASSDYPLVLPAIPDTWIANFVRRSALGKSSAPTIGYYSKEDGNLQFTQTDLPADEAATAIDGQARPDTREENADGIPVTVYFNSSDREVLEVWAFERDGVTMLIRGASAPESFRTLVTAAMNGSVVGA